MKIFTHRLALLSESTQSRVKLWLIEPLLKSSNRPKSYNKPFYSTLILRYSMVCDIPCAKSADKPNFVQSCVFLIVSTW